MDFRAYLSTMVEKDASDLYLSSGAPINAKINGILTRLEDTPLTPEQVREAAWSIMSEEQITEFEHRPEMNLAISEEGVGRFRVNIFRQRNSVSMVIRNIKTDIPDWSKLGLDGKAGEGNKTPASLSLIEKEENEEEEGDDDALRA